LKAKQSDQRSKRARPLVSLFCFQKELLSFRLNAANGNREPVAKIESKVKAGRSLVHGLGRILLEDWGKVNLSNLKA
jgi:hypothetical protein